MNEITRHEKYKELCKDIYPKNLKNFPKDVIPLYAHENKKNGFFAYACKYHDRIVIVFRGTEFTKGNDLKNDYCMGKRKAIPEQAHDAYIFTERIKQVMKTKYPNYKLDLTGHSLGGSLAQYTHVLVKGINETVTFNSYGTDKTLKEYFEKKAPQSSINKITNYCVPDDMVGDKLSKGTQLGKVYYIDKKNLICLRHKVENMKPLSTRRIQKNKNSKSMCGNSSSNCTGSYTVQGYTRSDGTKVREYIRTCGKHNKMSMEERIKGQAKYKGKRFQDIPLDELEEAIGYFV
ncbi:TPA: hypothetical protein CPT80_06415 [Candidatus Gastranaerophilales bacterium HUM_9]|nr:MAG TPA: hypothetical protein CPT80_06415 [Candidatus Gastranaerophilales bacterium HUM_9]HBX34319.1 hypothetical protein [Cyanobacteria bacterium UBA11440]